MGNRKVRLIFFLSLDLVMLFFFNSCIYYEELVMENYTIEKESIKISFDCTNFKREIKEVTLENENSYYVFEDNDLSSEIYNNKLYLRIDFSEKEIKSNHEYLMTLRFSGGYKYIKIFLGNPISKISEIYPCDDFQNIRIIVLEQSTIYRY